MLSLTPESVKLNSLAVDLSCRGLTSNNLLEKGFSKYGEGLYQRVPADICFLVENKDKQELLVQRDLIGKQPIYYRIKNAKLYFSDSISDILEQTGDSKINHGFLAEYLTGHLCSLTETVYQDIYRVAPGEVLYFKNYKLKSRTSRLIDGLLSSTEDYELRELLEAAVANSLNIEDKFSMQLSGGLDSSAIYSLARLTSKQIFPINMTFLGLDCDESDYVKSLKPKNLSSIAFSLPESSWVKEHVKITREIPSFPNGYFTAQVRDCTRKLEINNMLTGYGGDELFTQFYRPYLLRFREADFKDLFKQIKTDLSPRSMLAEIFPEQLKKNLKRLGVVSDWIPQHFSKEFRVETAIEDRLRSPKLKFPEKSPQKQVMFDVLFNGTAMFMREHEYRNSTLDGVNLISPF